MKNKQKYELYTELAFECLNIRNKAKTRKDYNHFHRKALKYKKKADKERKI